MIAEANEGTSAALSARRQVVAAGSGFARSLVNEKLETSTAWFIGKLGVGKYSLLTV